MRGLATFSANVLVFVGLLASLASLLWIFVGVKASIGISGHPGAEPAVTGVALIVAWLTTFGPGLAGFLTGVTLIAFGSQVGVTAEIAGDVSALKGDVERIEKALPRGDGDRKRRTEWE